MIGGRGIRLATLVAGAGGVLVAASCMVPTQLGCSRSTEPCHLAGETTLYSDPSLSGATGTLSGGPSGETLLSFIDYAKPATDAGAEAGANDSGVVVGGFGATPATAAVPRRVVIVSVDASSSVKSAFLPPLELSERTGNTSDIGVTYTGKGLLFSWVEQRTSTDTNGMTHTESTLRYGLATGAEAPPAHDVVSCDDCAIQVAAVATHTTVLLFYAVQEQGKPATSALVRMSPAGDALATFPLPKSLGAAGTVPAVMTSNGALLVRLAGGSYVVRDDLALSAGPFVPTGSSLSLVIGDGDPYAAWLAVPGATSSADAGTATFGDLGFESGDNTQDLMLGRFSSGGSSSRISTASIVIGVARDGATFGLAFSANDREYFALAGADGQKNGGDLDIGPAIGTSVGAFGNRRVLRSTRGPHQFSVLGLTGTKLTSREVSCE